MQRRISMFATALTAIALMGGQAQAASTATTTFQARLIIQAECKFTSSTALDFGTTGLLDTDTTATSTLNVMCTNKAPYNIGLDAGDTSGSTVANRLMADTGTDNIKYNIYTDATHATVWGNTVGTDMVSGTGNGAEQTVTLYGQVPVQDTPASGGYKSTVTATITF